MNCIYRVTENRLVLQYHNVRDPHNRYVNPSFWHEKTYTTENVK